MDDSQEEPNLFRSPHNNFDRVLLQTKRDSSGIEFSAKWSDVFGFESSEMNNVTFTA